MLPLFIMFSIELKNITESCRHSVQETMYHGCWKIYFSTFSDKLFKGLNIHILTFYFEIIVGFCASVRSSTGRTLYSLCSLPKGNILQNCTRIPQLGYWHLSTQDAQQFHDQEDLSRCPSMATPIFLLAPPPGNH